MKRTILFWKTEGNFLAKAGTPASSLKGQENFDFSEAGFWPSVAPRDAFCDRYLGRRGESGPTAAKDELLTPRGAGSFPALVVVHGCSGVNAPTLRSWARRLVGWGYAAPIVAANWRRPLLRLRAHDGYWRCSWLPMRIAGAGILDAVWIFARSAFLASRNTVLVGEFPSPLLGGCGLFGGLLVGLLSQCWTDGKPDKEQSDYVSHVLLLSP